MRRGPQRLDRVHRRAVARDAEDRPLRLRDRDADGTGKPLADAAAAAAVIVARSLEGEGLEEVEVGRDRLVDHDDVLRRARANLGHGARHRRRRARPGLLDARLLRGIVSVLARLHRAVALGGCRGIDPRQGGIECFERGAGIRDDARIEGEIVSEPRRPALDLQHLGAGRERRAGGVPDFLEERPTHHQNEIVARELLGDAGRIEGQRAAIGRMIGREGVLAAQTLEPHRGAELVDQLYQRLVGTGAGNIVTGDDGRVPGGRQQLRHGGNARRIGARGAVGMAGLAGGDRSLLLHHVDGQRHEDRACRRLVGDLEGALEDRAQLVGALDLHAPLGNGRGDRCKVMAEDGIAQAHARVLLAGRHDHRRVVLERAVDRTDRIAEARRHMEVHESGLAARLGIEVGGAGRDALMQVHDIIELRIVGQRIEQRTLGRPRIAEDAIDAVIDERLQKDLTSTHLISPFQCSCFARSASSARSTNPSRSCPQKRTPSTMNVGAPKTCSASASRVKVR